MKIGSIIYGSSPLCCCSFIVLWMRCFPPQTYWLYPHPCSGHAPCGSCLTLITSWDIFIICVAFVVLASSLLIAVSLLWLLWLLVSLTIRHTHFDKLAFYCHTDGTCDELGIASCPWCGPPTTVASPLRQALENHFAMASTWDGWTPCLMSL